jgi:hypothetical protein
MMDFTQGKPVLDMTSSYTSLLLMARKETNVGLKKLDKNI